MNTKLVVIGSLLLTVLFVIVFYLLLQNRTQQLQNSLLNTEQSGTTTVRIPADQLTQDAKKAAAAESFSLAILQRGSILSYDQENKTASVLVSQKDEYGRDQEKLLDISLQQVSQVLCWPETLPVANGSSINVREAYFPMQPGSRLYLSNQVERDAVSILPTSVGKFAFFHLVKTEFSENEIPLAKEIAIINC